MSKRSAGLTIYMRRGPRGLEPVSDTDRELLERLPIGQSLETKVKHARRLPDHRHFWWLLNAIVKNDDRWPTAEHLLLAIKYSAGYTMQARTMAGREIIVPSSISFAEMSQTEFREFRRKADLVLALAGIDVAAYENEAKRAA